MIKYSSKFLLTLFSLSILSLGLFLSCTKEAESKPQYVFKPAPNSEAAAKIQNKLLSKSELQEGIESDLYEAEMKVYEIKMARIKSLVLETLMKSDPLYKGDNDKFLDEVIAKGIKIGESEIDSFAAERGISKDKINKPMKERIKTFLRGEKKKEAVDTWITMKTKNNPVEIYLKKPARPVKEVPAGVSPFMGAADAKVTIVEFSDFQCPYCKRGAKLMTELKGKYGDKIKVVFKHFPLPFHQNAKLAATAANCAGKQDKKAFWDLHDKMFDDQQNLAKEGLVSKAEQLKLKKSDFETCLSDEAMRKVVQSDIDLGKKVGVKSTPTFFVNGKMVNGAQPIEVFSELIDEELSK